MRLPDITWLFECIREHSSLRGLPARFDFGREAFTRVTPSESLVLLDEQPNADQLVVPCSPKTNNQLLADGFRYEYSGLLLTPCEALVIAVSTASGPRIQDHVQLGSIIKNQVSRAIINAMTEKVRYDVRPSLVWRRLDPKGQNGGPLEDGFVEVGARYSATFILPVPIVSPPISVATVGGVDGYTHETTLNVPFDGDHTTTFAS